MLWAVGHAFCSVEQFIACNSLLFIVNWFNLMKKRFWKLKLNGWDIHEWCAVMTKFQNWQNVIGLLVQDFVYKCHFYI